MLPAGWSVPFDRFGQVYYYEHLNQRPSYEPPPLPPFAVGVEYASTDTHGRTVI
jgi:hypothetical protein